MTSNEDNTRKSLRITVLREFVNAPNQILFLDDLCAKLGFNRRNIQSTIYNARRTNPTLSEQLVVIAPGNAWRYEPPDATTPIGARPRPIVNGQQRATDGRQRSAVRVASQQNERIDATASTSAPVEPTSTTSTSAMIYEEIGRSNDVIIVRDTDGELYRLTPFSKYER